MTQLGIVFGRDPKGETNLDELAKSIADRLRLPGTALAPVIDSHRFGFADTRDLPLLEETIGQERAVEALEVGLQMKSVGFNIYACGPSGTGKSSLVRRTVRRLAQSLPAPPDWCYVHNFQDSSRPACLSFPAGAGRIFKQAMATLLDSLRRDIPSLFETKAYLDAKAKLAEESDSKRKVLFRELTELGRGFGFGFEETPSGFGLVPLKAGRPMLDKELGELSEEDRRSLNERRKMVESEIREFGVRMHALIRDAEQRLGELDRQVVIGAIEGRFESLRRDYVALPTVLAYLERVHDDVVHSYKDFLPREGPVFPIPALEAFAHPADLTRYEVNLVIEHDPRNGAPVVEEPHPTYTNLIGKIERKVQLGVMYTDFTQIHAGSVIQANGGYLILDVLDVLRQPFSWEALKRLIKTGEVKIEDPGEFYGFTTTGVRPAPIPLDIKLILVGSPHLYNLLQAYDEGFARAFKVKADFDVHVPWSDQEGGRYAQFVARLCREERLPHFRAGAVAEIIRQAFRLAERQDRLSLRFSAISDLIREAAFWAQRHGHELVGDDDVEAAVAHRRRRADLPEQWIQDDISEGTLMVDLEGEVVGQVNGLSVYLLGDYSFGRPCRITARTFIGTKGVIDIQREAELAGHVHSKGVMTLAGFLAGTFAGSHPFALSATLTFEQTYSEVEGDSASLAELTAILSSLAEVPVHQQFAVTGSVNQHGEIQPVGGVNEKIEGFFESCKKRGLSGKQAVVIPARNKKHLALRRQVVEAVEAGRFSIYATNTVAEALELLTGIPAGERGPQGEYPSASLYGRAAGRLADMARTAAAWKEHEEAKTNG
jgi:lon-related putative ATP-dependent protease